MWQTHVLLCLLLPQKAPRVQPDSSFIKLYYAWKCQSKGRFWGLAETSQTITIYYKVTCSSFSGTEGAQTPQIPQSQGNLAQVNADGKCNDVDGLSWSSSTGCLIPQRCSTYHSTYLVSALHRRTPRTPAKSDGEFHKPPRTLSSPNIWTVSSESVHGSRGCTPELAEELYFSCVTQKTTKVLKSFNSAKAFQLVPHNVLEHIMVTKANPILDISSAEVSHPVAWFSATRNTRLCSYHCISKTVWKRITRLSSSSTIIYKSWSLKSRWVSKKRPDCYSHSW